MVCWNPRSSCAPRKYINSTCSENFSSEQRKALFYRESAQVTTSFLSSVANLSVLIGLGNIVPGNMKEKLGVVFENYGLSLSVLQRATLRQEEQFSFQKSVILWSDRQVLARWSMDKTRKCSGREILFENFHAFLKKCKYWRHKTPFWRWVRWTLGRIFSLLLIRETCFLWPSFYRRKEDNVVSYAIVFSLPKHTFKHSLLHNCNE